MRAGEPGQGRRLAAQAQAAARTVTRPSERAEELVAVARVLVQAGEPSQARQLVAQAQAAVRTVTRPSEQALAVGHGAFDHEDLEP